MDREEFRCKTFRILQQPGVAKVGTDAFLLGAWAPIPQKGRVLDIGTGTGVLALLAAARAVGVSIDAIDLQPQAIALATENFKLNGHASRLQAYTCPVQQWAPPLPYDLIVSNPPFFRPGHARLPEDPARQLARHGLALPLPELASSVARLLHPGGLFGVVLPAQETRLLDAELGGYGLRPNKRLLVHTTPKKPVRRALSLYSRGSERCQEDLLVMQDGPGYTEAFQNLLRPYYLEF